MSKLDKLMRELCPNGVEFKKLGEVCEYEQPIKYIVASTDYSDEFDTPVLTAGQSFILGYTNEIDGIYNASRENPVIIFDDFIGAFKWVDFPFKVKSSAMKILRANDKAMLRYIFHCMGYLNFTSDEHKRLWIATYSQFKIPVPPLEVQREVVRILDSFTELTVEPELTARQKQYEYYRDLLLTFNRASNTISASQSARSVEFKKLGEIATEIFRGYGITREQVTTEGIPCVRYGEIYTTYGTHFDKCISHTSLEKISNPKYFEHGDILFAITGEKVEDIAKSTAYIGNDKCLAGGDIVVLKHNQNPKYLSYALATSDAVSQKTKGKIKSKVVHSSVPAIKEIKIPLPPLEEQEWIVKILDRFDKLCNDLSEGLPAEIEARKRQYEFYRDKLLSFGNK